MSRTFNISCRDCKETLWVGQRDHIYTTEEALSDFNAFLFKHKDHGLIFECEPDNEYVEFEKDKKQ